jgi:hypothetical protein
MEGHLREFPISVTPLAAFSIVVAGRYLTSPKAC